MVIVKTINNVILQVPIGGLDADSIGEDKTRAAIVFKLNRRRVELGERRIRSDQTGVHVETMSTVNTYASRI
jgi:hypothetical protein